MLEKIPLAGIARVMYLSNKWLLNYIKAKYAEVHRQVQVSGKSPGKLTIECDELWSYVGKKDNKQWVWLALDIKNREIVGVYIGDRSKEAAKGLWMSLPPVYRQCAVCYIYIPIFGNQISGVFPKTRHRAVDKSSGKTSHIERFNNTLRQRVSRLVRKTLSFSKSLEHHISAIWYFIHHYNASLNI